MAEKPKPASTSSSAPSEPPLSLENLKQAKQYLEDRIKERVNLYGSAEAAKDDAHFKQATAELKAVEARISTAEKIS